MEKRTLRLRMIAKVVMIALLLVVTGKSYAYFYDFSAVCPTGQTLYYNIIDAENHYVELTCPWHLTDEHDPWDYHTQPSGNIILPESVQNNNTTYTVTRIGSQAFYCCDSITNIVIPNTVTLIGSEAFWNCRGLSGALTIPNSVTRINEYAFYYCSGLTGSLVIPNSVTYIGYYAFCGCNHLTDSLFIPSSVTTIAGCAFSGCSGFSEIQYNATNCTDCNSNYPPFNGCGGTLIIGNNVERIPANLFMGCNLVGSLNIPNSVTSIGDGAFAGRGGFTGQLIIPNSVTTIGQYAFSGCSGFSGSLTIPNSVTSIGQSAFNDCSGFTGNLTIGNSVTTIGSQAFLYCRGFTSVISLAEAPPSCGYYAFGSWITPPIVYIPCGFEEPYLSISWGGFNNFHGLCSGTVTVVVNSEEGGSVTGGGTFEGGVQCTVMATANDGYTFEHWELDGVTVSNNAEFTFVVGGDMVLLAHFVSYDNIVFADANVKSICIFHWDTNNDGELCYEEAASVTSLGNLFQGNWQILSFEELQYFTGLSSIGNYAFSGCSNLSGNLTIPNSVITIGNYAFNNCGRFTGNLTIPNSVTSIGNYAFAGCSGFDGNLTIGNSVTSIGNYAFNNCSGFTGNLSIPISVTSIGSYAFQNCSSFTGDLTIGNSVTAIDQYAFSGCSGFTGELFIGSSVTTIGNYAFNDCSGFTGSLTIPDSVILIGYGAFKNCSGFTGSLTIGNSVTSISNQAFYYCSGFTDNLTIGNSVTTIGQYAFSGCSGFTGSLTIPNSVITIGYAAFGSCSGFTGSLTIPNSVTTIGQYAFSGCSGFTGNLTIPNYVTTISYGAFNGCSGFTSMNVLPEAPPTLSYSSFYNFPKSIPVYVPCGSLAAYQSAAYWNEFTNIQETCSQSQMVTLSAGWNWFSPNVEITLEDLQNALVDALPNANSIMIKSKNGITTYNGETWRGQLDSLDVTQMYRISVGTDCEITLSGMPINPAEHPVTIHNGANWIAFPLSESMSLNDVFGGFAVAGDMVKSKNGVATYNGTSWRGSLNTLEPGQGYIFNSNVQSDRTFTFPIGAK